MARGLQREDIWRKEGSRFPRMRSLCLVTEWRTKTLSRARRREGAEEAQGRPSGIFPWVRMAPGLVPEEAKGRLI